jgi:predicted dehydrogenase
MARGQDGGPARVGVIGCGWWSSHAHLPALSANRDAVVAGLADPDPVARSRAAERFGVAAAFADAEELVSSVELDAVIIAVPHVHHYDAARLALVHDLHVLLEKPMVLEPEHGRALVAEARRRARELVIGYPWHYNEHSLALRDAIAAGELGELEFASCLFASIVRELYRGNPMAYGDIFGFDAAATPASATYSDPAIAGGGQGQTQVTHSSALLFWLTGLLPVEVSAYVESFELAVDLVDAASIRFDGGAIGSVSSTGSMLAGQDELLEYRIFGRAGHALFDVTGGRCTLHGESGEVRELRPLEPAERYPEAAPVNNLVGIVRGEQENGSPAEIGLLAVEFLDALYRSAREGRPIAVPPAD